MAEETATVTTLTAEVRVLMVGSRQITLSVYRQLDEARLNEMNIFGRVRASKGEVWTEVVGVDKRDGSLVRGRVPDRSSSVVVSGLPEQIRLCESMQPNYKMHVTLGYEGRKLEVYWEDILYCTGRTYDREARTYGTHWGASEEECRRGWRVGGNAEAIDKAIAEHDAMEKLKADAEAAPLIVLAGLR